MTRRYFYTDPLAAAWMAKHFGMRFERGDGDLLIDWDDMVDDLTGHIAIDNWVGRYRIQPDSQQLLKPCSGDLLLWRGYGVPEWKFEVAGKHTTMSGWDYRIIQRNGIAFHWPESEVT